MTAGLSGVGAHADVSGRAVERARAVRVRAPVSELATVGVSTQPGWRNSIDWRKLWRPAVRAAAGA